MATLAQTAAESSLLQVAERHAVPRLAERLALLPAPARARLSEVESELRDLEARPRGPAAASARHLLDAGGKRVRPILALLAAEACAPGVRLPGLVDVALASELIHAASLLHDDVIDLGEWRRGRPAARLVYGNAASVLGGNLLLVQALERVQGAGVPGLLDATLTLLGRMVDAESLQLACRGRLDVGEDDYFAVVEGKTASVFAWSATAGGRVAGAPPEALAALEAYGRDVGVAFQLVDDVLDLVEDPAQVGKSVQQDLETGVLTHPLIAAARRSPVALEALLGDGGPRGDALGLAVRDLVERSGGLSASRAEIERRTRRARAALERLPAGGARETLDLLAAQLAARGA